MSAMTVFAVMWVWGGRCRLTEGAKDNEGEGIANNPLADGSENHKQAAEEEICSWIHRAFQIRTDSVCRVGM